MQELDSKAKTHSRLTLSRLPSSIWMLGLVSMFMDMSSEMIHGLLPTFLVTVLAASTVTVGLIEGVGEATASISKLFSGWLSDHLGKRKALVVLGYSLAALSKPLFALAPAPSFVLLARFADRVGKGIRGAPRDALIADLVPLGLRGAAYGLRQSLDTVGAFAGPLIAIALMAQFENNFRLVFWLAVIPGLVAVTILAFGVREPEADRQHGRSRSPIRWNELGRLGRPFWNIVIVASFLTLARFSEAFLLLRAGDAGLSAAHVPLVLVVMNIVYAASAYPMGALSDRFNRKAILSMGLVVLIVADVTLAFAGSLRAVMAGVCLWGLHLGMTQGLLSALVAEATPSAFRGSAFGLFNFTSGVAILFASLIAGLLWDIAGAKYTFMTGAVLTFIGLVGMLALIDGAHARPKLN